MESVRAPCLIADHLQSLSSNALLLPALTMAEPIPNEPDPRAGNQHVVDPDAPSRSGMTARERRPDGLLSQARARFKELAVSAVERCELLPEMARAVVHSLELGFSQTIKEDGPAMRRQFDQDVAAAVTWATEKLVETCRHIAADVPGRKRTPLQNLAVLEVQALEIMLPELSPGIVEEPVAAGVPPTQLQLFCALLNDGLDLAQKATAAADRRDQRAFRRNYELSRIKLRDSARVLRQLLSGVGPKLTDVSDGLQGFKLELASHTGSLRAFLKALHTLDTAARSPQHRRQAISPRCLVGDLLPTLFHWHFEFTISTPHNIPTQQTQELIAAAHGLMWQKVERPVAVLLAHPDKLHPAQFKDAVEAELRQAIQEVNQQFAADHVSVSISSNNMRAITRRGR
jgi:hypothetical protein